MLVKWFPLFKCYCDQIFTPWFFEYHIEFHERIKTPLRLLIANTEKKSWKYIAQSSTYFWRTSRRLIYQFSIETKTEEKTEKLKS